MRLDESLVSNLAPFEKLNRNDIRQILDKATPKRIEKGVHVFDEGASADRFYLLLDGYVRVVRITPHGEQVTALHIPAGQLLGIAAALGRDTYPATAVAASECLTLSWSMSLWSRFTSEFPGFGAESYKTVGVRVGELNERIVEFSTQQVEQRVANALLRLINQTGRKTPNGIEIDFPITRQDISEMAGTTLHTVSRLLSAWEKAGTVESTRKHVVIRDPHGLVTLATPQKN